MRSQQGRPIARLASSVLNEPRHQIALSLRANTERTAMSPLKQPLLFQHSKVLAQRGLADFEDRSQFIQMDSPATRYERGDFLLSLGSKDWGYKILGHNRNVFDD